MSIPALLRRGVVCQGQQKWQSAKEDLERVLQREPGNKRATVSESKFWVFNLPFPDCFAFDLDWNLKLPLW